jgi:hypothetical protein
MDQKNGRGVYGKPPTLQDGDFYFDGLYMVFTAKYHARRGYCCNSGCRHCPFKEAAAKKVS